MDLATAERLASVSDPKGLSALKKQSNDPVAAKAVAEQFGALLMQGVMQGSDGEAIAMAGSGVGSNIVSSLFANTIAQAVVSGDKLGLADALFRSIEAKQHSAAAGSQAGQPGGGVPQTQHSTGAPPKAPPSPKGFPLSPYWQGNGLRPLGSSPPPTHIERPGGFAPSNPGKAGAVDSHIDGSSASGSAALFSDGIVNSSAFDTTLSAQVQSFAQQLGPSLQEAGRQLGVSPRILLAHAALETGWGRSIVGNNLFGIKAGPSWQGAQVTTMTHEMEAGQMVPRQASFRAYPSLDASVQDYVELISNSRRYQSLMGLGDDAAAYGRGLVAGGYATDTDYPRKLDAVATGSSVTAAFAAPSSPGPLKLFATRE